MIFIAKPKAEGYRADIDGLRAIAIIGVLLFHFDIFPFSGGFVGVDVFFVISGFLITNLIYKEVTATKTFDYKRFYIRRIRRLFPALIVTLFITFVFCILLFSPEHLKRASGALISAVFSVSNIYFWNESSYFDTLSEFKPFLHTWSLSVEEQFYYVWPLLLVFLLTKLSKPKVFFTITLLVIVSLLLNVVFSDGEILLLSYLSADIAAWFTDGATTIFYLTPFRIFELGIGALLVGIIHLRPKQGVLLEFLLFLGLSCIAYAMLTFNKVMTFPSYNALLPTLGAALVIYAGTAQYLGGILRNRLFVGIGLISYSLYLVHWPIYVLYKYYQLGEIDNADKIIIFILSILLAVFMYHFVEQPFRYKKTGVHINTKTFLKVGLACTVLLSSSAAFAWIQQDWGWRVAPPPRGNGGTTKS